MKPPVLVSRVDRLGDLILSLPALGFLRDHGFENIALHCSAYACDIAVWAEFNGLCSEVFVDGSPVDAGKLKKYQHGLSLFHCPAAQELFSSASFAYSVGPRTKLSAFWTYRKTVAQHRSRVKQSEMHYNLDLARAFLKNLSIPEQSFRGLPALKLPKTWATLLPPELQPDLIVVASNRGSAEDWPFSKYLSWIEHKVLEGRRIDVLLSGSDADVKTKILRAHPVMASNQVRIQSGFSSIRELIVYLSRAQEVLSSSTGPLHIAHALGVPVTGIYPLKRVESFERWRPDGYWHAAPVHLIEITNDQLR